MRGPSSLFHKDPALARFLSGGPPEAEALLGSPLPQLPPAERQDGREVFLVRFHPPLKALLPHFLKTLLAQIGAEFPDVSPRADVRTRDQAEYESGLAKALRSIRATDRRMGLANLFWLAYSRDVALALRELEQRHPTVKKFKYSLHPLLPLLCRRLDQAVRRELERDSDVQLALLAGGRENTSLVDAILDDGFAFTEPSLRELDLNQVLGSNRRYRLAVDVFGEIQGILVRETERRLRESEKGLLARLARHAPGLPKEQLQTPAGVLKLALNAQVLTYLLADAWNTGARLSSSARLKAEVDRRGSADLVDAFLDVVHGLKRFELISWVRERIQAVGDAELDERVRGSQRLYGFGESAQVVNNAVNATVLFLDLRGFTKTSEGQISERDLTRELYAVFDAFVPHVRRFGGAVDKFLGDGMMITYGTEHADPKGPLNALRTAILCQESLRQMREAGKTYFKMGVSVHFGRVYLARFIADEDSVQNTVIGRNVNLAGRLSSAAKKSMDEDEVTAPTQLPAEQTTPRELTVTVDETGQLFNEGIALSRASFVQLESQVELGEVTEGGKRHLEFFDEETARRIQIRYAGDAKFKGVKASFPVFEVDYK